MNLNRKRFTRCAVAAALIGSILMLSGCSFTLNILSVQTRSPIAGQGPINQAVEGGGTTDAALDIPLTSLP